MKTKREEQLIQSIELLKVDNILATYCIYRGCCTQVNFVNSHCFEHYTNPNDKGCQTDHVIILESIVDEPREQPPKKKKEPSLSIPKKRKKPSTTACSQCNETFKEKCNTCKEPVCMKCDKGCIMGCKK
jgi:hypothetical protein